VHFSDTLLDNPLLSSHASKVEYADQDPVFFELVVVALLWVVVVALPISFNLKVKAKANLAV
jgi:hypothetical protein